VSLPVFFRLDAINDLEAARACYEERQVGLGAEFLDRMDEAVARICATPELFGVVWGNVRAARFRRFSYVVYYRIQSKRIEVLAVMHGRRDAEAWRSRGSDP